MYFQMIAYFLSLSNTLLYEYTTIFLFIHILKNIWIVFYVLTTMIKAILKICMEIWCEHKFSIHVEKFQKL